MSAPDHRGSWGSRLGFILAASGSAVGVGAIWKFPYITGRNGGGAFLLAYLGSVLLIGIALLLAELSIGRMTHRSATPAFRALKANNKFWPWIGRISVLCVFIIYGYYCVVGGWTVAYFFHSLSGDFIVRDTKALTAIFSNFTGNPWDALGYTALYSALTVAIVLGGVEKGIERLSKVLLPGLFILMIILIVRSLTLPGAMEGVKYFVTPDFSKLTGEMLVDALGLAFFSLSLGGGMMIAYGSYLPRETKLVSSGLWVAFFATLACILAGFMILPAVFAFHVDPAQGPALTFVVMPSIFAQLPFSHFFAAVFFLLLIFAALTSSVSILEPITAYLIDEWHWKRKWAAILPSLAAFVIGIPAALSFGVLKDATWHGRTPFDLMDYLAANVMMPFGGLFVTLFVGWAAWPRTHGELASEGYHRALMTAFRIICAVIAPILICVIWYYKIMEIVK
jgi:NSS family neurotransmitter:Na+ symporter